MSKERRFRGDHDGRERPGEWTNKGKLEEPVRRPSPGKVTRVMRLEQQMGGVQRKGSRGVPRVEGNELATIGSTSKSSADLADDIHMDAAHRGMRAIAERSAAVQAKGNLADDPEGVRRVAAEGTKESGGRLPYLEQIQKSFGAEHDLSTIQAHIGGRAAEAREQIGANAYAMGEHIVAAPSTDLHTMAHEAAHVVQQRAGVHLPYGLGQTGDEYEKHADAVADRVARGESAQDLLAQYAPRAATAGLQLDAQPGRVIERDITVHWNDDSTRFYHNAVSATARLTRIPAAKLWQPMLDAARHLHHRVTSTLGDTENGSRIRVHIGFYYAPGAIPAIRNLSFTLLEGHTVPEVTEPPGSPRARQPRGRSRHRERAPASAGDGTTAAPASDGSALQIVGRDGDWLVFNRVAFRHEVARYLWGERLQPTLAELVGRDDIMHTSTGLELEIGATHWMVARPGFAVRPGLRDELRPEVRRMMNNAPDLSNGRQPQRPHWVPDRVWQRFLAQGEGVFRYEDASPIQTDIILIRRGDGWLAGYAEEQEDPDKLYRQLERLPATTLQRFIGRERPDQAAVRWLAQKAPSYNRYMWRAVNAGTNPTQARREYQTEVNNAYLAAYISLLGFMGSGVMYSSQGVEAATVIRRARALSSGE